MGFVLFIIAEAGGIVQSDVEIEAFAKQLCPDKLVVLLMIIVGLVVIEARLTVGIGIFSAGIIASSVLLHLLFRGIIPRHVSLFRTVESEQLHERVLPGVGALQEIRIQLARCSLDIAVASDI